MTYTMDPRDQALLAACPVVAAPRFGALPDMANGQRIVVARNGWFVQTRLDWLDSITALGLEPPAMRLPYGEVQECLRFSFGQLPIRMIEEFVAYGRQHLPDEAAGVLIYSRSTGRLRLAICEAERASPVRIDYRRPPMASGNQPPWAILRALAPKKSRSTARNSPVMAKTTAFGHFHRSMATVCSNTAVMIIVSVTAMP